MEMRTIKAKNNNIERDRTIAREEQANAVLRMREAAEDIRLYLSEEGVFSEQLFLLERSRKTAKGALRAIEFGYEKLGQQLLSDFDEGVSE